MASSGLRREKHLLTIGILRLLDDRYADLPRPGRILQLIATNLRNRPLTGTDISSMRESIMSLYHNLITGSKDFPLIPFRGSFRSLQTNTPFVHMEQEQRENTKLHPLLEAPAGILVPAADSASSIILTPVLPEKTELGALMADRRNCVRRMEFDGRTVTRVISPVYHTECIKLPNRWRVTDYRADGQLLMSVLCQFTGMSAQCAKSRRSRGSNHQRKRRKDTEKDSSFVSPPKKRLRV